MGKFKPNLIILSVLISIFLIFISTKNSFAASLFQDNFESQSLSNWEIINGSWGFQTDSPNNHWLTNTTTSTDSEIQTGDFSWTNYEFSLDLISITGVDKNVFFRVNNQRSTGLPNHSLPVGYGLHISGNLLELQKWILTAGNYNPPLRSYNSTNAITHIKVIANNSNIKIYANNSILPSIDYTDNNSPILSGRIALAAIPGSPSKVWYDNIQVSDLTEPIPLNVPDLKQYSSPWGNQTYDHANLWSTNPTITHWGCALTSADMILQYYGFTVNPKDLNTWLNSQPDGYIGNGLLNWLAISRYSETHATNQPSLEFSRQTNTNENLSNELTNNRPAILEEPGHFVVATSQTDTSFTINDPAYSDRPTLDSYNNTFNSIETYTPSHTNLSYIMLTINPEFDLKVYDTNNQEITGNTFIQNPLIDDMDNSKTSGNALKIFMFPKPENGIYKVEVSGNGIYEIDSYLYDVNGNVNLTKTNGIVGDDEIDNFQITIGQNNITKQILTIDDVIKDLNDAKSKNKIKSNYVYQEINSLLNTSKKLILSHQNTLAKTTLKGILQFIKAYTPSQIDPAISKLLQSEIQTFLL
ncbi:hypothetical protein BH10PAT1_BH10PAT1_5730 [soil metagenome]